MSKPQSQNPYSNSIISGIANLEQSSIISDQKQYKITVNAPHGHFSPTIIQPGKNEQQTIDHQHKQMTNKIPYTSQTTGYDNNRQFYSEQQIHEAFKIIDINKDGVLTVEDLSFFLDCMDEEYTLEEVKEMIRMVSSDGEKVGLDDFRKIGKGRLVPFAGIKIPDQNSKIKETLLDNLKSSNLTSLDPQQLIEEEQNSNISYDKFQEEKARKNQQNEENLEEEVEEDESVLKLRTSAQIRAKRLQFSKISMLNIQKAIQNFKNLKAQSAESKDISQMLSISENQARSLFLQNSKKINSKQFILDAILFCQKLPIKKLQLILLHMSRSDNLNFDEWMQVLVYMMGVDQKQQIRKRLLSILKHRKLNVTFEYDKYFILQVMSQQISLFNW